jgi:RNA polymerase sigma-70 factor, ECF subfamily
MLQASVNYSSPQPRTIASLNAAEGQAWGHVDEEESVNDSSEAEARRSVWSQVCADHYQPGLDFARRRVENLDDALDMVQDAVVRLLKYLPDPKLIKVRQNYWLKTIQNSCIDQLRQRQLSGTTAVPLETAHDDDDDETLLFDIPDPGRGPEMSALINEETERLLTELEFHCADFAMRERNLLALHLQGFSNNEIANVCDESVNLIRADMNALLAKIRYRVQHAKRKPT